MITSTTRVSITGMIAVIATAVAFAACMPAVSFADASAAAELSQAPTPSAGGSSQAERPADGSPSALLLIALVSVTAVPALMIASRSRLRRR